MHAKEWRKKFLRRKNMQASNKVKMVRFSVLLSKRKFCCRITPQNRKPQEAQNGYQIQQHEVFLLDPIVNANK